MCDPMAVGKQGEPMARSRYTTSLERSGFRRARIRKVDLVGEYLSDTTDSGAMRVAEDQAGRVAAGVVAFGTMVRR